MDKKQGRRVRNQVRGPEKAKSSPGSKQGQSKQRKDDIMSIAHHPVTAVAPTTPVYETIKVMVKAGFRRLPIVDPGTKKLLGIITVSDLIDFLGGGLKYQIIEKKYGGSFYKAINEPIRTIMTTAVITIRSTAKISEAMEAMKKHNVGGLPVVDEDHIIQAIVSEQDIVRLHIGSIKGTPVSKVMTKEVVTEQPGTAIIDVEKRMIEKKFRRLPIVSDGKLIGLATVRSWLRFFGTNQVFQHLQSGTIQQVLQTPAIEITMKDFPTIHPDADVSDAIKLMRETRRGSLLVVDNEELVGIITERDFFKLL